MAAARPKKLTVAALRTWLKKQDPNGRYDYYTPPNCLIAQFARAQGYNVIAASVKDVAVLKDGREVMIPFDPDIDIHVAKYHITGYEGYEGRTYGGALEALEIWQKELKRG